MNFFSRKETSDDPLSQRRQAKSPAVSSALSPKEEITHYEQEWRPEEDEEGDEDHDWHLDLPLEQGAELPHKPRVAQKVNAPGQNAEIQDPVHQDHYLHHEHHLTEYILQDPGFDEGDPVEYDAEESEE